jgi:TonB family protein
MNLRWPLISVAGIFVLLWPASQALGQTDTPQHPQVVLSKLSSPTFPPMARVARVAGDVEIKLQIRQDGSVESAEIVRSASPLLKEAALDSARQSKFECHDCTEALTPYAIRYTFAYTNQDCCQTQGNSTAAGITESQNHITILTAPACTCDPSASIVKVRSAKCLFLWHCATRYGL